MDYFVVVVFLEIRLDKALDILDKEEGERDIDRDTAHTSTNTLVETTKALGLPGLGNAVDNACVLVGLKALHLGLHDINRRVSNHTRSSSRGSHKDLLHNTKDGTVLRKVAIRPVAEPTLEVVVRGKADGLVASLTQDGGAESFVNT